MSRRPESKPLRNRTHRAASRSETNSPDLASEDQGESSLEIPSRGGEGVPDVGTRIWREGSSESQRLRGRGVDDDETPLPKE